MSSGDWNLEVDFINNFIDDTLIKMMAYRINAIQQDNKSMLKLSDFSEYDYEVFLDVLDSFYFPENKLMGKLIWADERGAVYLRSKERVSTSLPSVPDFGRKGVVFCGYQMLGTNPFDLVVCLHKYKNRSREKDIIQI